jgi:hypothetical protein
MCFRPKRPKGSECPGPKKPMSHEEKWWNLSNDEAIGVFTVNSNDAAKRYWGIDFYLICRDILYKYFIPSYSSDFLEFASIILS